MLVSNSTCSASDFQFLFFLGGVDNMIFRVRRDHFMSFLRMILPHPRGSLSMLKCCLIALIYVNALGEVYVNRKCCLERAAS